MPNSELFTNLRVTDDLKEDFATILALSEDEMSTILDAAAHSSLERFGSQYRARIHQTASDIDLPFLDVRSSLGMSRWFLNRLSEEELAELNTPERLASDAVSLGLCLEEDQDKAEHYFRRLRSIVDGKLGREKLFDHYTHSTLPNISQVDTTADYRGVFSSTWMAVQDVDKYEPTFKGLVKVAIVAIKLDNDSELHFQASQEELKYIIDKFRSVLGQLSAMERSVQWDADAQGDE